MHANLAICESILLHNTTKLYVQGQKQRLLFAMFFHHIYCHNCRQNLKNVRIYF